ncbi:hypothetical protein AN1V17_23710 [Vallitalea sediminicola]
MKKLFTVVLACVMTVTLVLSGCGKKKEADTADEKQTNQKENIKEKVNIEIMMQPWVSEPLESDIDPYKKWLDETYDANFTLTTSSEFETEILTRFAAGTPPDIILCNYETLLTLYSQDILVKDWNKYLDKMPTVADGMGDAAQQYYTRDGKLITLTNPPGGQGWTWNIRKDWLSKLGLSMPTTPDEFLDVARAFTKNDPDGNGKDDTYGFTSAGAGKSLGDISNLKLMFGPTEFYVGEDGTVKHPVTDGNEKLFLDFLKTIIDEELIDPDWYSQGWDDRKPNLYKGLFGTVFYPPMSLLNETEGAREGDHAVIDWYDTLIPMPVGTPIGGKQQPTGITGSIKTVSANAEEDSEKFDVILKFLEGTNYPNEGYWKIRWGGCDGIEQTNLDDGYVYANLTGTDKTIRGKDGKNKWLFNWGKLIAVQGKDKIIKGTNPEPGVIEETFMKMQSKYENDKFYPTDDQLLELDLDASEEVDRVLDEYQINYILGNDTDYDAFVQRWLDAGGQKLMDQATEQFKDLGLIK